MHIIGDENPTTGLKNKVKGFQFKNKIQVPDAAKKTFTDEPLKPFMVNQLTIAFERGRIMLSPYDEILHKQLIDYEIERISQSGLPVFSSENEHFIDALGLAYLAFVLEFPTLTQAIKEIQTTSKMSYVAGSFQASRAQIDLAKMSISTAKVKNPWDNTINDPRELRGDRQEYFKVPLGAPLGFYKGGSGGKSNGWGSRGGKTRSGNTRSSW